MAPGAGTNGNIGVVAIQRDSGGNFTSGTTLIGQIATGGNAIAGMMLSPDGTRLYVTSEIAAGGTVAAGGGNPVLSKSGCEQGGVSSINGLLTVVDVSKAERRLMRERSWRRWTRAAHQYDCRRQRTPRRCG